MYSPAKTAALANALHDYLAGEPIYLILRRHDITHSQLMHFRHKQGIPPRPRQPLESARKPPATSKRAARAQAIRQAAQAGIAWYDIKRHLGQQGISVSTRFVVATLKGQSA